MTRTTCEVDLDLLPEDLQGQKLDRRRGGASRIVYQRRDPCAADCFCDLPCGQPYRFRYWTAVDASEETS